MSNDFSMMDQIPANGEQSHKHKAPCFMLVLPKWPLKHNRNPEYIYKSMPY
jgi:hypothetical protein